MTEVNMADTTQSSPTAASSSEAPAADDLASRKPTDRKRWVSLAASLVALLAAFGTITATLSQLVTSVRIPPATIEFPRDSASFRTLDQLREAVAAQKELIAQLETRFREISAAPTGSQVGVQVAAVRADLTSMAKRMDGLEAAILDSPTKALAVPLLRQDLEHLKSSYQRDIDASKREIDRIYDQNKWFIGLMFSGSSWK